VAEKRRIGITGATGFVGCRLAERLTMSGEYEVVSPVRRFSGSGLARLARLDVQIVQADLLNRTALRRAFEGCAAVVHCAYGRSGSADERFRVTVEGTENVLSAAREAGVGRVVHLSTAAVHATEGRDRVDEQTPLMAKPGPYERMKIVSEEVVWRHHREHGLPTVVLRPTLIYGPYGRRWSVAVVEEIRAGAVLVDGGRGLANLVYVDNLVDSIILAIETGKGDGQAFLVVDDECPSWRAVYEAYAQFVPGAPPLRDLSVKEIEAIRRERRPGFLRGAILNPLAVLPRIVRAATRSPEVRAGLREVSWVQGLVSAFPKATERFTRSQPNDEVPEELSGKRAAEPPLRIPDAQSAAFLAARVRYDNHKLREVLQWTPRIDLREGLRRTGAWLAYQRLAGDRDTVR